MQGDGRSKGVDLLQVKLLVNVIKGCWDKQKRGTANPDAGQGYMEKDICGGSDLAPTQLASDCVF